ncbi:MAG: DUF5317 family protein [Limnochordia bacterium]|jgi:hypothetical protein
MFIPFFVGLVFVLSLLTGGSLKRLAQWPLRASFLFFLPLLIQVALFNQEVSEYDHLVHLVTYFLLLLVVLLNLHLPGAKILFLGLACNFLVIALNGGYMPMSIEALEGAGMEVVAEVLAQGDVFHNGIALTAETKAWFLADVFYLPPPFPLPNVFSIGDVLLILGGSIFCWKGTRQRKYLYINYV